MTIAIDITATAQGIDGFGAADPFALASGYSSLVADFLFRQDIGIGLTILRSELYIDNTSGVGWPTYYTPMWSGGSNIEGTFAILLEAFSRGVTKFIITSWVQRNVNDSAWPWLVGGGSNAALISTNYAAFATAISEYVQGAWAAGITGSVATFYVSQMNEPDITPGYPQTSWTTSQARSFLDNNLGPTIATLNSANPGNNPTRILYGETSVWSAAGTWWSDAESDSTAKGYIYRYATHQYDGGGAASAPPGGLSHPIWMTESSQNTGAYDDTMTSAQTLATTVYNALTTGNASAWVHWFAEDVSDNDSSHLVGTNASNWNNQAASTADWNSPIFPKRAYVMGNFSKFVRPGSVRIGASGAPGGVNVLAFAMTDGTYVVVCQNTNGSGTAATISFNAPNISSVTPWITDPSNNLAQQSNITVSAGSFSTTLTATSVTTFVTNAPPANFRPPIVGGRIR